MWNELTFLWNELTVLWNHLTMERNDRFYRPAPSRLPISLDRSRFLDVTQRSPLRERFVKSKKRLRGRLTTDKQIKIFVTENTESDTFCMEEYSEKYTIVV